eukprot:366499-Chlamydomonas_euryale.AAC.3
MTGDPLIKTDSVSLIWNCMSRTRSWPMWQHFDRCRMWCLGHIARMATLPAWPHCPHGHIALRTRVMSPRTRVISPRTRVMSPRTRVMSPRTRVISPRTRVMSPRTRVMSPRTRVMSPRTLVMSVATCHCSCQSCPLASSTLEFLSASVESPLRCFVHTPCWPLLLLLPRAACLQQKPSFLLVLAISPVGAGRSESSCKVTAGTGALQLTRGAVPTKDALTRAGP